MRSFPTEWHESLAQGVFLLTYLLRSLNKISGTLDSVDNNTLLCTTLRSGIVLSVKGWSQAVLLQPELQDRSFHLLPDLQGAQPPLGRTLPSSPTEVGGASLFWGVACLEE